MRGAGCSVISAGVAEDAYAKVMLTVAVWLREPLVAVMVRVRVPRGSWRDVVSVRVLVPEPFSTGFGAKATLSDEFCPLNDKVTLPVKPPTGVTCTVKVAR